MAKRVPFRYGRGQCIFCEGQPPEVSISKEHLFADWLRDIFPRNSETTHTLGILEWAETPGRVPARETPLINGDQMKIDREMQQSLATWATKTVMTAEYVHPSKVVIHQSERTWLKG